MVELFGTLATTMISTLRDVLPIASVLLGFQLFVLRRPIANLKQIIIGFVYVLIGLCLFLVGLEEAIFPLGEIMARQLTDPNFLYQQAQAAVTDGVDWRAYGWVYAFAFAIGFATTVAEPALIAVGIKAERVSGGAISAFGLRIAVAIGVAIGVTIGCYRIVSGTDLWIYIMAVYVIVIVQTTVAPKIIIPLSYDSGGVTTSTVTVPLLAALGLGLASTIPGRSPMIDGFGLIAFASVFPIMTVMGYAQITRAIQKRHKGKEGGN